MFSRCLLAVGQCKIPDGVQTECLIIDNNSKYDVAQLPYVQDIVRQYSWISVIRENKPGLSFARERGYRSSKGDWIVFFDDDNEPATDYLVETVKLADEYPNVGIWGPGNISVEYMKPVDTWFEQNKQYFQERHFDQIYTDSNRQMQFFYPPGTGMILHRTILQTWADKFSSNTYSVLGRTGDNLESSEDIQIIYTGLDCGFSVGSSPTLVLNHLTSERKSTFSYIKKLAFGIAVSGPKTAKELSPTGSVHKVDVPARSTIYLKLMYFFSRYFMLPSANKKAFLISYIKYFAGIAGTYRMINKPLPQALSFFIQHFELEHKKR